MSSRRIKIGIDVGGTFTHAVAIDGESLELVGKAMVPTTHTAAEGVARGVVLSMHKLLDEAHIAPDEVVLIAHSTTQATNALLEGDVAPVGIIGMGKGAEGWLAKRQTNVSNVELAQGKFLVTYHRFLDVTQQPTEEMFKRLLEELLAEGAQVFVASEAFGVDRPENEQKAAAIIRAEGHIVTSASEISQLYGLKVRTRTAMINASMMPKMLETAAMTEQAVHESGIKAPLMIMRSDGGIMDVSEMRRRPILTMLSGPAAGVAAALMYAKISDGLFLEVGGTSTDISIIKNGRPMIRAGEVGGHRLHVRTLDVRTVGIGGGSIPRIKGRNVVDVGPRSAHIAGLRYVSFADREDCSDPALQTIQPKPGDASDYLAIAVHGEEKPTLTFTTTEAANVLGLMKQYGRANTGALKPVALWLAKEMHSTPEQLCKEILHAASVRVIDVVKNFILEYKLDPRLLALVGGGGGAEAIVPFAAEQLKMDHGITGNAEVISAIGVALGMIQETLERTIIEPTDADILKIRNDALQAVLRMGAAPDTVDVRVEVDTKQKRVIATARGTPEMRKRVLNELVRTPEELLAAAAKSLGATNGEASVVGGTEFLTVYQMKKKESRLFGLVKVESTPTRVLDREGVVRLKLPDATAHSGTVGTITGGLYRLIEEFTMYGDAGALQPDIFVIVSGRIIDLSGLVSKDQVLSLLRAEAENFAGDEPAVVLIAKKG